MKQLLLITGLACLVPSVANAQTKPDAPVAAPQPTAPQSTLEDYLRSPAAQRMLDSTRPEGVKFFALPVEQSRRFSVEIVRRDSEVALRTLAEVMGVRIVIDPAIKFLPPKTRTIAFNYVDEDVFGQVSRYLVRSEEIEMWKSAAGTYFFAAKPKVTANPKPGELNITQSGPPTRHPDPFVVNPGNWKPVEPQPGWEKREFNGHEFFYIPAPTAKSQTDQK